jgi:hypothetical protein
MESLTEISIYGTIEFRILHKIIGREAERKNDWKYIKKIIRN